MNNNLTNRFLYFTLNLSVWMFWSNVSSFSSFFRVETGVGTSLPPNSSRHTYGMSFLLLPVDYWHWNHPKNSQRGPFLHWTRCADIWQPSVPNLRVLRKLHFHSVTVSLVSRLFQIQIVDSIGCIRRSFPFWFCFERPSYSDRWFGIAKFQDVDGIHIGWKLFSHFRTK